ncbi:MAG: nuclear transport factor 2 family protein [Terriglobales bacterium]
MRTFIDVIALLCLLTGISSAQTNGVTEKQLLTILHQMYAAEKKHDLNFIRSYLSDDFAEVGGDGRVYHWKDVEAGFADMELREYKLSDCVTKVVASEVAYMSCAMQVDASFKGNALPRLFRVTWLWTRANDRWVVRFEQATIVPAATPKGH